MVSIGDPPWEPEVAVFFLRNGSIIWKSENIVERGRVDIFTSGFSPVVEVWSYGRILSKYSSLSGWLRDF